NKLHIDHILPEKWNSIEDWKKKWTEDQSRRWLHKIGNLTLLSGKKNISASNGPFDEKKNIYKKDYGGTTAFEISKKIVEKSDWLENDVKERQKWMIEQIETILGLKLDGGTAYAQSST
ncbi:MAG: HNH endonuclease family protein, partial [Candidatus Brocadiales bacterium]|nr:HNH endonuclease family protein [Candidatus Brocadiales bacterium]